MIFGPDNPHRFETYLAGDGHPAIRVVGVTQDEWLAAQAEIERLRAEVNAGVRVACALESILDSHLDSNGALVVTEQAIAEANAALDARLGVVRETA